MGPLVSQAKAILATSRRTANLARSRIVATAACVTAARSALGKNDYRA
jgi:hypothetical protein